MQLKGQYRFKKKSDGVWLPLPWSENLIMLDDQKGINLILRQLAGNITDLVIDELKIGTGDTAPTDTDSDLETPVLSGVEIATSDPITNPNEMVLVFFIPDNDLADDTYKEIGLFSDSRIFSRSVLDSFYTKNAGDDTMIEYKLTASNT